MQIVCPNCSARYVVDPAAIGRQGRTVQCFRCGHKWLAHAEASDEMAPTPSALTDTRPVPDFIIRPQNHDEPVSLPTIPPERGMPTWLKLTLGLLILIGLIGGAGYALRDQLPGWIPGSSPSGPMPPPTGPIAKPPPPPQPPVKPAGPASLVLDKMRIELVPGGGRAIVASGDIVNTGATDAIPRRIRFTFKGSDGKPVGERAFDLPPDRIAPNGRQPFRQRVDDPPAGADAVDVTVDPLG